MKTKFKLFLISLIVSTGCSTSYTGISAYEDDIYYSPGDAPLAVQEVSGMIESAAVEARTSVYPEASVSTETKTTPTFSGSSTDFDDRDFTPFQQRYAGLLETDSIVNDTVIYEAEEEGYYIGGFSGSEMDMDDAERLRMYYPQGFGYWYGDGYNTAMLLAGDPDWNVYVDGNYVWWTPTWSNTYLYNDFRFHPNRYGRLFVYGQGYSSGLNIGFGFGYGYGTSYYGNYLTRYPAWDFYFDSYYPWNPYYGYYGGYYSGYYRGHHGHHSYYGHDVKNINYYYGSRNSISSKTSYSRNRSAVSYNRRGETTKSSATSYTRRSVAGTKSGTAAVRTTTRRGNTTGISSSSDVRRKQAATRYSNSNKTRKSYSATRRSNVPSYSTPKVGTRPSYNRTGTTRRVKSSVGDGTLKARPSGYTRSSRYSKVKSGDSKKGSSSSSGTVRRSSSSSSNPSKSTYRSSGSSSRSSGSVKSSSGSSRSSGTNRSSSGRTRRGR